MLTVVNKFFNIIRPAAGNHPVNAYFGQKDAQQYILIQRMVRDFNHDATMRPVAIVREDNGLALSSRNSYLSDEERESALVLSRIWLWAGEFAEMKRRTKTEEDKGFNASSRYG